MFIVIFKQKFRIGQLGKKKQKKSCLYSLVFCVHNIFDMLLCFKKFSVILYRDDEIYCFKT